MKFETLIRRFARIVPASICCSLLIVGGLLLAVPAGAQTFNTLASFNGTDGSSPDHLSLVQATDGNLYGTTQTGGTNGQGTVFKITTGGTLSTLYSFCSLPSCTDGASPDAGLIQATDGNFYGTTVNGGAYTYGTVFKITTGGTLTTLHSFCAQVNGGGHCTDGANPHAPLIQAANGNLYGTTNQGGANGDGAVFEITTAGTFTLLHSFAGTDGMAPWGGVIQAANGNFYGTTQSGGASGNGTIFNMTAAGKLTTLHSFDGTHGSQPLGWLVQAANGTFYGTTEYGGTHNQGTVFKMTSGGTITTLYSFCAQAGCADGAIGDAGLVLATDGNLYGLANGGGANSAGTIYKLTTGGKLTTLHSFDTTNGGRPVGGLVQDTNGTFYGLAGGGGANSDGTVFSLSIGLNPFISLLSTSGKVGSNVGILGQGFDSSSVVKFNGVTATTTTLTGTAYITATVPAGASTGYVTVTTGATTLTSTKIYVVHNSWGSGAAMPTAVKSPAAGMISNKIYVVGGVNSSATVVGNNQVYNPVTNTWSTGAALPATTYAAASAVVKNVLYVISGTNDGTTLTNAVWAYNPATNTWSGKAAIPTARVAAAAAVQNNIIYVIGGQDGSANSLTTVESYNPATNTWKTEAPLLVAKSFHSAGLLGSMIVATGGQTSVGVYTGDNEGYNASTNSWKSLTADPTARGRDCAGAISGQWYVAGGYSGGGAGTPALTLTELFAPSTNKWTTLAPMPQGSQAPGAAVYGGQLYCFGGAAAQAGTVLNKVQIYQP